jgi:hypothetical protein
MHKTLKHLIDTGEDLIQMIEGVRDDVDSLLPQGGDAMQSLYDAIRDMSANAFYLTHSLRQAYEATVPATDPAEQATVSAIDNLLTLLTAARGHLATGRRDEAHAGLACFDLQAQDVRAAFRQCQEQGRGA